MKYQIGQKIIFRGSVGTIVAIANEKKKQYKIVFDCMTAYLLEDQFEPHE
jgi:hypothetical protein